MLCKYMEICFMSYRKWALLPTNSIHNGIYLNAVLYTAGN